MEHAPEKTGAETEVVVRMLRSLADGDMQAMAETLAERVVYSNVSLPTIRGRERVVRYLGVFRKRADFDVVIHRVAQNGPDVLTERTDVITVGPYRLQFWVCGIFEVEDGRITLWRDYFDWWNILCASARGVLGTVAPSLRPTLRGTRGRVAPSPA